MALTHVTYNAANRRRFALPFKYSEGSLVVTVDDIAQTLGDDYQIVTSTQEILFSSAVSGVVKIQRDTSIQNADSPIDFTEVTVLSASDLNQVFEGQVLYGFQELKLDGIDPLKAITLVAKSNNLSDLTSFSLARANLGVYSVAQSDAVMDPVVAGSLVTSNNLSDVADAATARDNLDLGNKAYTEAQVAGVLLAENNLSEFTDPTEARTNLDVYSVDETDDLVEALDAGVMQKDANLSDVSDVATSRDNLKVYSKAEIDAAITELQALVDELPPVEPGGGYTLIDTQSAEYPGSGQTLTTYISVPAAATHFKAVLEGSNYGGTPGDRITTGYRTLFVATDRVTRIRVSNYEEGEISDPGDCRIYAYDDTSYLGASIYCNGSGDSDTGVYWGSLVEGQSDTIESDASESTYSKATIYFYEEN